MASATIETSLDQTGGTLQSGASSGGSPPDPQTFIDSDLQESSLFAFTDFNALLATDDYNWESITRNQKGSSAVIFFTDIDRLKISDYGGSPFTDGFRFDQTNADRHFIKIVTDTGTIITGGSPPTDLNTKVCLFSGFLEKSVIFDFKDESIKATYTGIEDVLNDVQIVGAWEYDLVEMLTGELAFFPENDLIRLNTGNKCIFNENGNADMLDLLIDLAFDMNLHRFFSKSGSGKTKLWSLGDILNYLYRFYYKDFLKSEDPGVFPDTNFDDNKLTELATKRSPKFRDFVKITTAFYAPSSILAFDKQDLMKIPDEFFSINPNNFSLEGLGLKDALIKTVKEAKDYMWRIRYDPKGVALMDIVSKDTSPTIPGTPPTTTGRDESDRPLKLSRGQLDTNYAANDVVEGGSRLEIIRDQLIVGRVIVIGDNSTINTVVTNWDPAPGQLPIPQTQPPFVEFSKDPDTFTAQGGTIELNFANHLQFYPETKDTVSGVSKVTYRIINKNFKDTLLTSIENSGTPPETFNSDKEIEVFRTIGGVNLGGELARSESEKDSKAAIDKFIYIMPLKLIAGASPIAAKKNSNGNFFGKLVPLKENPITSAQWIQDINGGIILTPKRDQDAPYADQESVNPIKSIVDNIPPSSFVFSSTVTNQLILFARINIKIDHRIKGIAEISVFDTTKHETIVIRDNRFKLNLSFKDLKFDAVDGGFVIGTIPDGFIRKEDGTEDSKRRDPIIGIQKRADLLLDKYVNHPQNAGSLTLTGWQHTVNIGDYIQEIGGDNRKITYPTLVTDIGFTRATKTTTVGLGSIDD